MRENEADKSNQGAETAREREREIYIYIYMLSRQLGDHVFAFEQVNGWDAFAHWRT